MKLLNEQMDLVRRIEQKIFSDFFKKTKYLFLKSKQKLTAAQSKQLLELLEDESKDTVKAYNLLQSFKEVFNFSRLSSGGRHLSTWQKLCEASKIPEMITIGVNYIIRAGSLVIRELENSMKVTGIPAKKFLKFFLHF